MAASVRKVFANCFKSPSKHNLLCISSAYKQSGRNVSTTDNKQIQTTQIQSQTYEEQDILKCHDYFKVRDLVTVKDMFHNRVHFGHHIGCRNEYMKPYLFGTRLGYDIIDLEQTLPLLQDALNFTAHVAYNNGIILFVSRHRYSMPLVEATAMECEEYAHCRYWKHGIFTNTSSIFGHDVRLPDLCIFVNTQNSVFESHVAVTHAAKLLVPSVGIVDSSSDPRLITYPVPGNDDSVQSIKYYLELFKKAILIGKQTRKEEGANN